jgi:hypothetical protein
MMNGKKERELLIVGLERLLRKKGEIAEEYRALAEMLEGIPAGLFLDWVVVEEEAHQTLLIRSLKKTARRESGNCATGVEIERDTTLGWVERLKMREQAVVADCRSLKSQSYWTKGDSVDALLDALVMDSEKHQRFLLVVEKAIETIMMSRPH